MPDEHERFVELILQGDRRRAEAFARDAFETHGIRFLYEEVVRRALDEVGRLWQANRITVATEHLATAAAQSAVAALYPRFAWPAGGPRLLLGSAEGEQHDFGGRLAADLLALDGWDERFLGANVPAEDLARMAREHAPRVVGISVTLPVNLSAASSAIRLVRSARPSVRILIGGRATVGVDDACALLGADAVARSASDAVEVVRGWK